MVAAIACLIAGQAASAQAVGVITGRVTEVGSGEPIAAVSVTVAGSTNGTLTGEDGRYTLRQVVPGSVVLNFTRIGFEKGALTVTVREGAPATGDLQLKAAVLSLQAFVTTVTGPTRKIELGTTTAQIAVSEKIAELPVQTMGNLLSGRAAGVQVSSAGASGAGSRIRIRGQSSLTLGNDPLIYVDGIRVISNTAQGGGSGPSRFDDLSAAEIENIEVIKGPSAATLYGTEAANGVINITTKKGKSGRTQWNVFTENGVINDPNKGSYPEQYYRWGTVVAKNAAGTVTSTTNNTFCRLTQIAAGLCTKQDSLTINNVLNNPLTSPLGNGHRNAYGLQASGGTDRVQFFLSADTQDEVGVYRMPDIEISRLKTQRGVSELPDWQVRPNSLWRLNLRGNLSAQISSTATVNLSTGYITSDQHLPQNEDNSQGLMVNAIAGSARKDNRQIQTVNGRTDTIPLYGQFFGPMGDILSVKNNQSVKRSINSLQTRWQALPWLSTRATVGLDLTQVFTRGGNLAAQGPYSGSASVGSLSNSRTQTEQYSVDVGATASWNISSRFQNKFSTGVQYNRNRSLNTTATGNTFPAGGITVTTGANRAGSESSAEIITLGTFLEDQLAINDKIFLTAGLRFDDNSAFGSSYNGAKYPKFAASYVISDEAWFPKPDFVETFRVRAAYGASGSAPNGNDALRFYSSTTLTTSGANNVPAIRLNQIGNPNLKPEYSGEYEGGFDFTAFSGGTNVELTYFSKSTKDALISRDIAPSLSGITSMLINIGAVKNAGMEFVLNQRIIDKRDLALSLNVTGSGTRNKLVTLGDGVSPLFTGNRTTQKNTYGYPLYGLWGRTYTINDANKDGIVAPTDLIVTDTAQFVGPTYPKLEVAISPSLELFNHRLRVNAQFDHKSGHYKLNNTLRHQCQGGNSCRGLSDPSATLEQQAAAVGINSYGILTGFYEKGDFTRFRELSIGYRMPDRLAKAVRASQWNLVLTGRNLAVWTKYSGVDPEATVGNSDARGFEEYFSTPPLRTLGFRMNFTF